MNFLLKQFQINCVFFYRLVFINQLCDELVGIKIIFQKLEIQFFYIIKTL